MKIKTSEIEGAALDWAVAIATKRRPFIIGRSGPVFLNDSPGTADGPDVFKPSTDWSQGGPLIEMYEVHVAPMNGRKAPRWIAMIHDVDILAAAPLIAACRAIVAAKLGDTVDVPEELLS